MYVYVCVQLMYFIDYVFLRVCYYKVFYLTYTLLDTRGSRITLLAILTVLPLPGNYTI